MKLTSGYSKWIAFLAVVAGFPTFSEEIKAEDVSLGLPIYGGTGCPQGSASATLSPDAKTLSILFDQFGVEAGNTTGKQFDRKNCNVAVPVRVPSGVSVSIVGIDYRGFTGIPKGAQAEFNVEYFFAGSRGPRMSRRFFGPLSQDYLIRNDLALTSVVWSECGKDVNLRISNNLLAITNSSFQQTMISLDSIDMTAGLVFSLQFRQCIDGRPIGQPVYF